jgi:hypothetical protein
MQRESLSCTAIFYSYIIAVRGRPPKAKADKRTNVLRILLTKAERKSLDDAAAQKSLDVSAWARLVLLAAAKDQ